MVMIRALYEVISAAVMLCFFRNLVVAVVLLVTAAAAYQPSKYAWRYIIKQKRGSTCKKPMIYSLMF